MILGPALALLQLTISSHAATQKHFESCDLVHWQELDHEKNLIRSHPKLAKRNGGKLQIQLANGKALSFEDPTESSPTGATYRIIQIDPKEHWLVLYAPSPESMTYQLIHLKAGSHQELKGCPIWSTNHDHFVTLHEDLESGITENEASLWQCSQPDANCKSIWSAKSLGEKIGGRGARWKDDRVEILLARENLDQNGAFQEQERVIRCVPKGDQAHCTPLEKWKSSAAKHGPEK
jgi:hypothetical protein